MWLIVGATPQGFQMKITLANLHGEEHNLVEEAVGKTKMKGLHGLQRFGVEKRPIFDR